jgi:hypothetical protein
VTYLFGNLRTEARKNRELNFGLGPEKMGLNGWVPANVCYFLFFIFLHFGVLTLKYIHPTNEF